MLRMHLKGQCFLLKLDEIAKNLTVLCSQGIWFWSKEKITNILYSLGGQAFVNGFFNQKKLASDLKTSSTLFHFSIIKVWEKKQDTFKKWPLVKNPQFLSNLYETLWKELPLEVIILRKFHEHWTQNVDFFKWPIFERVLFFFNSDLRCHIMLNFSHSFQSTDTLK